MTESNNTNTEDKVKQSEIKKLTFRNHRNKKIDRSIQKYDRKSPQQRLQICTVKKLICKQDKTLKKKSKKLGFFIPKQNIFVPCETEEQYYHLKNLLMKAQLQKTGGYSHGFCYKIQNKNNESRTFLDNNQRSVRFENNQFYDANSNAGDIEHIEFL